MKATLKMLNQLVEEEILEMTLEQISSKYQESKDPRYLATSFNKIYILAINISKNYYGLDNQEISSITVEKLDYCLLNYKKGVAKFSTYFTTILKNALREKTQSLNAHKRKVIFCSGSYEAIIENGFDIKADEIENIVEVIESWQLKEAEENYCKLLVRGYSNKEIAEKLQVSIMSLCHWRKNMRDKINGLTL